MGSQNMFSKHLFIVSWQNKLTVGCKIFRIITQEKLQIFIKKEENRVFKILWMVEFRSCVIARTKEFMENLRKTKKGYKLCEI